MPSAVTDISLNGLNSIRSYEGRALRAYQDSVGVWTIGYGITNFDKGIGFKVAAGVTITADQAEELLYSSLRRNYLPEVERKLNFDRCPKPQGACDAGLSFHYNTGGIGKASWPAQLMAGNMSACRVSFESWNKAGGRVLAGLTRRRASEWNIMSAENYGHLTGPEEEGTRGQRIGSGELLTAMPLAAASGGVVNGTVADNGHPVQATPAPGTLRPGDTGPAVVDAQKALTAAGQPTPVTGVYDDTTTANATAFQQAHPQLTADGTIGPATSAALARFAAMKQKAGTVAKLAPAIPVASWSFGQWLSANAAEIALVGGCIVLGATVVYLAWHYRHELQGVVNNSFGRVVA